MARFSKLAMPLLCAALCVPPAIGMEYIRHHGKTNPITEGWKFTGDADRAGMSESGYDYWGISDLLTAPGQQTTGRVGYYSYLPTASQLRNPWRKTEVLRVANAPLQQHAVTTFIDDGTSLLYEMWDPGGWHYKGRNGAWRRITDAVPTSYRRYDAISKLVRNGAHNSGDQFTFYLDTRPVLTVNRNDLPFSSAATLTWGDPSDATRSESHWNQIVFTGDLTLPDSPPEPPLDRGHRILLERGLQILALTTPHAPYNALPNASYWATLDAGGFTTPYVNIVDISQLPAIPAGRPWALHSRGNWLVPNAMAPNLVSIQYKDEQDLGNPAQLAEVVDQFARYRAAYPNTILYTNQYGGQLSDSAMRAYMSAAQPDMLNFDWYPWIWGKTEMYQHMQTYRMLALGGHDGAGVTPIPYGRYVQAFPQGFAMSQSQINLDHFASWAFGYKLTNAFVYDRGQIDPHLSSALFGSHPDGSANYNSKTNQYRYFAEVNREGQNLGPALVRLLSTDVRIVLGEGSSQPSGVGLWNVTAGRNQWLMTNITAANISGQYAGNNGLRGDLIVGYFHPLRESFDGDAFEDGQTYFMIVNGLTGENSVAAAYRQRITVDFDFGQSGVTNLQRLNRVTGDVEVVNLIHLGGAKYRHVFELDGGKGELFKYNTGAPFVAGPLNSADFDLDGDVDQEDLLVWRASFGVGAGADADKDGDSDGADLLAWQRQFGARQVAPAGAMAPEPCSALLLGLMAAASVVRREMRRGDVGGRRTQIRMSPYSDAVEANVPLTPLPVPTII